MKIEHLKYLLLFFSFLITINVYSQQPDTVVAYEYVYITDTVWIDTNQVRDTNRFDKLPSIKNAIILIDATDNNGDLATFFSDKAATIPIKSIIMKEKQRKITKMKKLTFFGLTYLALNSSLFAQHKIEKNIGVYVKGYDFIQKSVLNINDGYESSLSIEPLLAFGIKGNFPFNTSFSLSPRISYTQMKGTISSIPEKFNFYFLSTDLLLNYYFLRGIVLDGRLYGGLRADYLVKQTAGNAISNSIYNGYNTLMFNYTGGIGFDIYNRIFLDIEYSNNINSFVKNTNTTINYNITSINLGCYLFRPGLRY